MTVKTFILVYMIWAGNSATTHSVEFRGFAACHEAGEKLAETFKFTWSPMRWTCVAKGEQ